MIEIRLCESGKTELDSLLLHIEQCEECRALIQKTIAGFPMISMLIGKNPLESLSKLKTTSEGR